MNSIPWSSMGWVDVVVMIAFLLGLLFGLKKGLSHVLGGLFEIITAQVVVIEYNAAFVTFLANRFYQVPIPVLTVVLFAVLAVVSILMIRFMFKLLNFIASLEFKQPLKNLGGALVGTLQFILFFALIAEFLMLFNIPFIQESFQQKSLTGPYLIQVCDQVHYFFERWIPAPLQI